MLTNPETAPWRWRGKKGKNKMKTTANIHLFSRLTALCLCLCMLFALAACGSSAGSPAAEARLSWGPAPSPPPTPSWALTPWTGGSLPPGRRKAQNTKETIDDFPRGFYNTRKGLRRIPYCGGAFFLSDSLKESRIICSGCTHRWRRRPFCRHPWPE